MRQKLNGVDVWIEVEHNRAYIYHREDAPQDRPYEIIEGKV